MPNGIAAAQRDGCAPLRFTAGRPCDGQQWSPADLRTACNARSSRKLAARLIVPRSPGPPPQGVRDICFTLVESRDLKYFSGTWRIESREGSQARLIYAVEVLPQPWLPVCAFACGACTALPGVCASEPPLPPRSADCEPRGQGLARQPGGGARPRGGARAVRGGAAAGACSASRIVSRHPGAAPPAQRQPAVSAARSLIDTYLHHHMRQRPPVCGCRKRKTRAIRLQFLRAKKMLRAACLRHTPPRVASAFRARLVASRAYPRAVALCRARARQRAVGAPGTRACAG